jgi:hypothetical protein
MNQLMEPLQRDYCLRDPCKFVAHIYYHVQVLHV